MAISWRPYISSIVTPISQHIRIPSDKLMTSRVSDERMSAANILDGMDFDFSIPAFIGHGGFILTLKIKGGQQYVVLYHASKNFTLPAAVEDYAGGIGLQKELYADAFVFFLIEKLQFHLVNLPEKEGLKDFLKINKKDNKFEIDFDQAIFLFGDFKVWKVTQKINQNDLIAILATREDGVFVSFDEKLDDFGIDKHASNRFFNLSRFVSNALNPIFVLTDQSPIDGEVKFESKEELCESVRLAQAGLDNIVLGPQSRSYFEYVEQGSGFLCIPLSGLREDEVNDANRYLEEIKARQLEVSSSHIFAFSYLLQNSFLPSARYVSSPAEIVNALDFKKSIFIETAQVLDLYDEYFIYDLSEVSDFSKWNLLCQFSLRFPSLRSPFIGRSIIEVANRLAFFDNSPSENIYLSLSASHWKHSFLEIYRMVEGLYYFSWMHKLKSSLGSNLNEFSLFEKCSKETSWSYNELSSIMSLFELIPVEVFNECSIFEINCLKGRFDTMADAEICRSFASALYSIRNSHVHQGLRGTDKPIVPTGRCWERLTLALYLAAEHLYKTHPLGMPPRVQK